jgi:hypothetical protein
MGVSKIVKASAVMRSIAAGSMARRETYVR